MKFYVASVISFIVSIACVACTTNVTNNNPGNGSDPVPAADCKTRCQAKATGCQAPAAQATQACGKVCDGSLTNDQLTCLEGKACSDLNVASLDSICPASGGSSGNSSGGTPSGGSTHFSCSLNGTCFKCADSAGVSKCSLQTGPGPGCTKTDPSYCE